MLDGAVALKLVRSSFFCEKITAGPRKNPAAGVKLMYDQTH